MALTINTNVSSLIAQRNLTNATNALTTSLERMSTGYTINHASDNAAGYSISNQWVTQLSSLDITADNAAIGSNMLTTAEDNYSLLYSNLQRVRDLTEQAANGTYGSASLVSIQAEITARLQEINRIAANTEFNGIKLMNGQGVSTGGINLQVGLYSDANSRINLAQSLFANANMVGLFTDLASTGTPTLNTMLGNADTGKTVADLNTDDGLKAFAGACSGLKKDGTKWVKQTTANSEPYHMIDFLDTALANISSKTTQLGAAQNRISSAISALDVQTENITSSLSTLRDTDIAKESSNYIQAQILQQASATLLSTANQLPSVALNLI